MKFVALVSKNIFARKLSLKLGKPELIVAPKCVLNCLRLNTCSQASKRSRNVL